MYFYIADTHFGHENIIKLCDRGFSNVAEMDAFMISRWQERVRPNDDVFVVGDFAYRNKRSASSYLEQLPGIKHLIVGNHDKGLLADKTALQAFASVDRMLELRDASLGCNVTLCHYPLVEWPGFFNESYHVYGHLHNVKKQSFQLMKQVERALNAGVEIVDYSPRTLAELIEYNRLWFEG